MKKFVLPALLLMLGAMAFAQTEENRKMQEDERKKKMDAQMGGMTEKEGWARKGGLGLDLAQLANINPYAGSGSNRLGLGGAIAYNANYKKNRLSWKNVLNINLSTQRIGQGLVQAGSDVKNPFEKALDIFSLNSNMAYSVKEGSKWAYSLDATMISQLLPSYIDATNKKIYLKEIKAGAFNTSLVSKLFSPATITVAPGIKYTHDSHFSAFLSPAAMQAIVIGDKNVANLGIHGTKLKDGSTTEYKQSKIGLGAMAKLVYTNTFFKKLNFTSDLSLFSDYLDKPQNMDVFWFNSLGLEIFKNFNLLVKGDVFYDDNKTNNITDINAIGGISGKGKRPNFIQQLLLTYNRNF
ncbi:MAG TPA: DUF3078 domain-containing protein [Saprospiraceae bacterium]|nr:DUF3078 domain-containing protein [Saprospiraceae bacterium]